MLHHIADDFAFMICLKDLHGVFPGPAAARKKKKSGRPRYRENQANGQASFSMNC